MDLSDATRSLSHVDHSLQSHVDSPAICLNEGHNLNLAKKFLSHLDAPPIAAVGRNSNITQARDRRRLRQSCGGNLRGLESTARPFVAATNSYGFQMSWVRIVNVKMTTFCRET
jgi:hypothetical protein